MFLAMNLFALVWNGFGECFERVVHRVFGNEGEDEIAGMEDISFSLV